MKLDFEESQDSSPTTIYATRVLYSKLFDSTLGSLSDAVHRMGPALRRIGVLSAGMSGVDRKPELLVFTGRNHG